MGKFKPLLILCLMGLLGPAAAGAPSDVLPSFSELQKLYDDGQYPVVLQKVTVILQLSDPATQGYDVVDLLMLKGETLLQTKDQASALAAFTQASKEASTVPTPKPGEKAAPARKPEQVASARAMAALVGHSGRLGYTPKALAGGVVPSPISLVDLSQRPAAFNAFLVDLKTELSPKAKAASIGDKLPPIVDVVQAIGDLRAVELIATKKTTKSDAMLAELSGRALDLMSAEVKSDAKKIDSLSNTAHKTTKFVVRDPQSGTATVSTGLRGLHPDERQDLQQMEQTLERIVYTCRDFQSIEDKEHAAKFKAVNKDAMAAGKEAYKTLKDKYSATGSRTGYY